MDKNIVLDIDSILNKEFSIDFKGYNPLEVDQFLDVVVKDYANYQNKVDQLQEEIARLQSELAKSNEKIIDLTAKLKSAEEANANVTPTPVVSNLSQVDILRRLSRLEQEVFNNRK